MDLETLANMPAYNWPPNADDIILKTLRNREADQSDRQLAAEMAGEYVVIGEQLAAELISIVTDPEEDEELRSVSAISFGAALEHADMMGFEDPDDILLSEKTCNRIQKTLRKIYMDTDSPKLLRRRVLEASVRAPAEWHKEAVRAAYEDDDEDWKLTAVFCMVYIMGFEDQIQEALGTDNPDIHYHAIRAAGAWEMLSAWDHVSALVKSRNVQKDILMAAMESAALIRPEEAESLLAPLLESDDEEIVAAAEEALALASADFDYYDDEFDEDDPF